MLITEAGFFWSIVSWRFDYRVNAAIAKGYVFDQTNVRTEWGLFRIFMQVYLPPPSK